MDSTTVYLNRSEHPEKYLLMWCPEDPRIFYNSNTERDISISFVGSVVSPQHRSRLAYLSALRSNGIQVYQAGGQRERCLSIEEYSGIHRRSKIGLNFCRSGPHVQLKGRVFEIALCGAMLLEEANPETSKWFEPMVDYVPFASQKDLVEKARYYLEHDSEREDIAVKGHRKAKEKYTAKAFWETIFQRVFA
jgi:spore maturation protein CgeB